MAKFVYFLICALFSTSCGLKFELHEEWERYKESFKKEYNSECQEKSKRQIWEDNVVFMVRHNLEADMGLHSYTVGLNAFSDMTQEEYSKMMSSSYIHHPAPEDAEYFVPPDGLKLNRSVDWRKHGIVSEVKNQGSCGSCYAFCSNGVLEAITKKRKGKVVSLSAQDIIDCSQSFGNRGCDGGSPIFAFKYGMANHGVDTEASYPYEMKVGPCRPNPKNIGGTFRKFKLVPPGDELALKMVVGTVGPVAIAVNSQSKGFQMYNGGIYDDPLCDPQQLNHCVVVVGYGVEGKTPYWIIKNSWSTKWGDQGYFNMVMGKNMCGITNQPIFALP